SNIASIAASTCRPSCGGSWSPPFSQHPGQSSSCGRLNIVANQELLWLALRNVLADRVRSAKEWKEAMNQFAILYGERFTGVAA
ncbi:MAG: hypothetical protein WBO04_07705, partial [Steroidobacteraceae bacterium]